VVLTSATADAADKSSAELAAASKVFGFMFFGLGYRVFGILTLVSGILEIVKAQKSLKNPYRPLRPRSL